MTGVIIDIIVFPVTRGKTWSETFPFICKLSFSLCYIGFLSIGVLVRFVVVNIQGRYSTKKQKKTGRKLTAISLESRNNYM